MTEAKQAVTAIREAGFSGYSKELHSKCRKPEKYGIQRIPAAESALKSVTTQKPAERPKADNRHKPCRIQARIYKTQYSVLQKALAASTHKTVDEFVAAAVTWYCKKILDSKNTAPDAGTSEAASD